MAAPAAVDPEAGVGNHHRRMHTQSVVCATKVSGNVLNGGASQGLDGAAIKASDRWHVAER